jgi:hypothetical protein
MQYTSEKLIDIFRSYATSSESGFHNAHNRSGRQELVSSAIAHEANDMLRNHVELRLYNRIADMLEASALPKDVGEMLLDTILSTAREHHSATDVDKMIAAECARLYSRFFRDLE